MNECLEIRLLRVTDAEELSSLLNTASQSDSIFFHPFAYDAGTVMSQIRSTILDQYYGLFIGYDLAGFYMLRGLDEGFASPMYGVFIGPQFRGLGLARLTLGHAFSFARLAGHPSLMLKVHVDNKPALQLYTTTGFKVIGNESEQKIMEYRFAEKN